MNEPLEYSGIEWNIEFLKYEMNCAQSNNIYS